MRILLTFAALLASGASFAVDCRLQRPVRLGTMDLLKNPIRLKNVVVDQTPAFSRPENFTAGKDSLAFSLSNLRWNNRPMGFASGTLSIEGKLESVGFSPDYMGGFNVQGSTQEKNGVKTYRTYQKEIYEGDRHAKGVAAEKELLVVLEKDDIVAITLKHPIFRLHEKHNNFDVLAFTGRHQTLCVTSAER